MHPQPAPPFDATTAKLVEDSAPLPGGPFEKRAGVPLHHQIKDDLFYRLRSGDWPPGSELPSEQVLCAHFNVSRGTLRRAVADLVNEGYIERHSGRGSFVCHPKLESGVTSAYNRLSVIGPEVDPGGKVLLCRRVNPNAHVSAEMKSASQVWRLERLRFTKNQPVTLQTSFIPVALCPDLGKQDLKTQHLIEVMRDVYGIHLGSAVEYLDPANADRHLAKHLGIPVGAPVFHIERTTYTVDGQIAEYRNAFLRGDIFRYRVELR